MVEKFTTDFEKTMKTGFISEFILMILDKEPCHGYKIGKKIEEYTLKLFKPPASTLYTALNKLYESKFIEFQETEESGKFRKVYRITSKGRETLKLMMEKHVNLEKSIESLISTFLGDTKNEVPKEFLKFNPLNPSAMISIFNQKSIPDKIRMLEFHKSMLNRRMVDFRRNIRKINKEVERLKETENAGKN